MIIHEVTDHVLFYLTSTYNLHPSCLLSCPPTILIQRPSNKNPVHQPNRSQSFAPNQPRVFSQRPKMDNLLNKAKGALSGNKSTSSSNTGTTTGAGAGGARKEDYGDKGIDAVRDSTHQPPHPLIEYRLRKSSASTATSTPSTTSKGPTWRAPKSKRPRARTFRTNSQTSQESWASVRAKRE